MIKNCRMPLNINGKKFGIVCGAKKGAKKMLTIMLLVNKEVKLIAKDIIVTIAEICHLTFEYIVVKNSIKKKVINNFTTDGADAIKPIINERTIENGRNILY